MHCTCSLVCDLPQETVALLCPPASLLEQALNNTRCCYNASLYSFKPVRLLRLKSVLVTVHPPRSCQVGHVKHCSVPCTTYFATHVTQFVNQSSTACIQDMPYHLSIQLCGLPDLGPSATKLCSLFSQDPLASKGLASLKLAAVCL